MRPRGHHFTTLTFTLDIKETAQKFGVDDKIAFKSEVIDATWDEETNLWRIAVRDVDSDKVSIKTAKVFVSAVGQLGITRMSYAFPASPTSKEPSVIRRHTMLA